MNVMQSVRNLTRFEWNLWVGSMLVILVSFLMGGEPRAVTILASLVGVTALIFTAKGDAIGQLIMLLFSLLYAVVSFELAYYGEMITYLGMTAPMSFLAMVTWLKHPYETGKSEVTVSTITKKQIAQMTIYAILTTFSFYFILKYFNNSSLMLSTLSITTSFVACYLTYCRSYYYALAYALNDLVLIVLWTIATIGERVYLPMIACFVMFFCNDIYGFYNWKKMNLRQMEA